TGPQHAEGVLIEPHEDVQAVLLDAVRVGAVASARALAAEPKARLVHGDVVDLIPACLAGDLERRGHGGHPAADDRELVSFPLRHDRYASEDGVGRTEEPGSARAAKFGGGGARCAMLAGRMTDHA